MSKPVSEASGSSATVVLAALTVHQGRLGTFVVRTLTGWGLPRSEFLGGSLDAVAARELATLAPESVATTSFLEQLRTYGVEGSATGSSLCVAYVALVADVGPTVLNATKSGPSVRVFDLDDLVGTGLLRAHEEQLLADAMERVRSKFEYTTVATSLVTDPFTVPELRRIYESVWGVPLHPANFRRKVLATNGFVQPFEADLPGRSKEGGPGPSKPELFSRGAASLLHPAMLRPESR